MIVSNFRCKVNINGRAFLLPLIYIEDADFLPSFVSYIVAHRKKSKSWKDKAVASVKLLVEYVIASENKFEKKSELFEQFVYDLEFGTILEDISDPLELWWPPRRINVAHDNLYHVNIFTDWLYDSYLEKNSGDEYAVKADLLYNPKIKATKSEYLVNLAAYHNRKNKSFLKHLIKDASEEQGLQTTRKYKISRERLNKDIERAKYFPEELFWNFIERFRLRGATDADPIEKRLNLRNVLITLLLHYGGLRLSEPFHLFTSDIKFSDGDSDMAIVEIHHPYDGQPPEGAKGFSTRAEYLLKKYQLYPRNAVEGRGASYGAGWKGMQLNRLGFAKVYWFYEEAGRYFFHLLRLYLQFQRMPSNDHPFLFTNLDGSPFSISSYNDAHEHAFKRLKTGLEYNKSNGVTSHGHRHAYGTRLTVHGVDELTIKNCMRHRSIESQQTYKTQSENDIQAELHTAHIRPARTSELNIPDYNDPLIFARDFNPFER